MSERDFYTRDYSGPIPPQNIQQVLDPLERSIDLDTLNLSRRRNQTRKGNGFYSAPKSIFERMKLAEQIRTEFGMGIKWVRARDSLKRTPHKFYQK